PNRDIPRAVVLSLLIQGLVCYLIEYFAANYFLHNGYQISNALGSAAPVGDMMIIVGTWLFGSAAAGKAFMLVQAFTVFLALVGTTLSCMSTGARVTYAMGRDEEVPEHFGLLHGEKLTLHWAIWTLAILSAVIAIVTILFNFAGPAAQADDTIKGLPQNFWYSFGIWSHDLAAKIPQSSVVVTLVSNFGTFLLYMMTCIVAIVAFREHHTFNGFKHMFIPLFGVAANLMCMLFYLIGPFAVTGMSWRELCVGFWQPESEDERLVHGSIAAIADGVGGLSSGEIASRMAIDIALNTFKTAPRGSKPNQILDDIFKEANLDIYNFGVESELRRMGTTLTACILRNKEAYIGHVGDCRVYLVRNGQIKKLTPDHTYVEMQRKLGLISQEDAMSSELRSVLTRSLGQNPIVQVDFAKSALQNRDCLILCSDGLHTLFMEHELADVVTRMTPADACTHFINTAENRGAEDNISIQVVRVEEVRKTAFYQGLSSLYAASKAESPTPVSGIDVEVGQVLDDRFEIIETIHRSGMSTVFKTIDRKTGETVAVKVPLMNLEADPAFYSRFEREEEIGKILDHPG